MLLSEKLRIAGETAKGYAPGWGHDWGYCVDEGEAYGSSVENLVQKIETGNPGVYG